MKVSSKIIAVFVLLTIVWKPDAQAGIFRIHNGNATAKINTEGSQAGVSKFTVDGRNHLSRQWYWYRVGTSGPEASVDTLTLDAEVKGQPDTLTTSYSGTNFALDIDYQILGGLTPTLDEVFTLRNTSTSATLDFNFFAYMDWALGNGLDEIGQFTSGNTTYEQATPNFASPDFGIKVVAGNTLTGPPPFFGPPFGPLDFRHEVRPVGGAGDLLTRLNNAGPDDLLNLSGLVGPDNLASAFQWRFTLDPGREVQFSMKKTIAATTPTPEPSSLLLFSFGIVGLVVFMKRKAREERDTVCSSGK